MDNRDKVTMFFLLVLAIMLLIIAIVTATGSVSLIDLIGGKG